MNKIFSWLIALPVVLLANVSSASDEIKTGYANTDLLLFCTLDYAEKAAQTNSQEEIESLLTEARNNNCLSQTKAGAELSYKYIGAEENGIVLIGQIHSGQNYFLVTYVKNIRTEKVVDRSDRTSSKVGYTENITFLYCEKYFQDRDIAFSGSGAIEAMEEAKKERGCEKMLGPGDKVNYRPTYLGNFYIVTYTDDNNQVYMNVLPTNYITPEE